jgi:hypothetical protein
MAIQDRDYSANGEGKGSPFRPVRYRLYVVPQFISPVEKRLPSKAGKDQKNSYFYLDKSTGYVVFYALLKRIRERAS